MRLEWERRTKFRDQCVTLLRTEINPVRVILLEDWLANHNTWLENNRENYEALCELRTILQSEREDRKSSP